MAFPKIKETKSMKGLKLISWILLFSNPIGWCILGMMIIPKPKIGKQNENVKYVKTKAIIDASYMEKREKVIRLNYLLHCNLINDQEHKYAVDKVCRQEK
ncbi:MAG: hypothetical protein Ta2E_05760 [Mycoplasmoidaceae bacterium]|nr:MAG: hypothetical protein Ta2E_05760 [Mycoplasmoidaceae bacterium]